LTATGRRQHPRLAGTRGAAAQPRHIRKEHLLTERFPKAGVDLGIVTGQGDAMFAFYRDTIGLEPEFSVPLPDGGVMHRLLCGASIFKIMCPANKPTVGITSTAPDVPVETIPGLMDICDTVRGYRFVTIWVDDLDEAFARCEQANAPVVYPPLESRPGVRVVVVEDPDGNWVEFVQMVDLEAAHKDLATKHEDRVAAQA
jgi:catechol 2,3-dioxygenase-like lactoylglutathione lyase family enzyme